MPKGHGAMTFRLMEERQMNDFGWALAQMRRGLKVARTGWNGRGMFLFHVPGSTFEVNRAPLLGIYPEGTSIEYHEHIDMKTAQGYVVPWLASQTDMLATDWVDAAPDPSMSCEVCSVDIVDCKCGTNRVDDDEMASEA